MQDANWMHLLHRTAFPISHYFCMTQETVRRLPFVVTPEKARIWIRANKGKDKTSEINESGKN